MGKILSFLTLLGIGGVLGWDSLPKPMRIVMANSFRMVTIVVREGKEPPTVVVNYANSLWGNEIQHVKRFSHEFTNEVKADSVVNEYKRKHPPKTKDTDTTTHKHKRKNQQDENYLETDDVIIPINGKRIKLKDIYFKDEDLGVIPLEDLLNETESNEKGKK